LKDKLEFTAHRIMFRCSKCGCILSATQDDFTGRTKSTAYSVLTTGGAVNALVKKNQGKDIKTVYVKIEDAGDAQVSSALVGKELPLDDLKAMAAAFDAQPSVSPAESPSASAPVCSEPAADIKISYAAPAEAPAACEVPVSVSYAAPAASAPSACAPAPAPEAPVKRSKMPVVSIIAVALAFCAIGLSAILSLSSTATGGITPTLVTLIQKLFALTGVVLMFVGLLLHRKNLQLLFGIGLMINAAATLLMFRNASGVVLITTIVVLVFFVLSGLYYILKGKTFGNPLKLILSIVAMAAEVAAFIAYAASWYRIFGSSFDSFSSWAPFLIFIILGQLFSMFGFILVDLSVLLYTPFKKNKKV
ncbi:MAG: hypothetical protein ACI4XQ_00255, partial [Eubacteriales bacterium]